MSSAARAVRKQTVASVNMGTDAKTKNKGKKMKKGKQDREESRDDRGLWTHDRTGDDRGRYASYGGYP